jgi:hypothetical protein
MMMISTVRFHEDNSKSTRHYDTKIDFFVIDKDDIYLRTN